MSLSTPDEIYLRITDDQTAQSFVVINTTIMCCVQSLNVIIRWILYVMNWKRKENKILCKCSTRMDGGK